MDNDPQQLPGFDLVEPVIPQPTAAKPTAGRVAEPVDAPARGSRAARLVALSDLHLDTPFSWAPAAVGRLRRLDLRSVLTDTVALAASADADALLLAGDIYEHDRVTPDTAAFIERMLNECPVPVIVAPGNHDYLAPSSVWATAAFAPHVHVFDGSRLEPIEAAGLTLWGAAHHRPANTPGFLDGFSVIGEGVHIALFHGSERAGLQVQGVDWAGRSKQPHAPFDATQIAEAGLHHAVVGHFHRRREAPLHTYPGNPASLAFGEPGDGGAVVIDVDVDGQVARAWHAVSNRQMHDVEIDVTGCGDVSAVHTRVAELTAGLGGLVRLTVTGDLEPSVDLVDDDLVRSVAGDVDHSIVRRSKLHHAFDLTVLRAEASVRGEFVRAVLDDDTLDETMRQSVLATGLRALSGRTDLDVAR